MPLGSAPVVPAGSVTLVPLCTLTQRTTSGDGGAVDDVEIHIAVEQSSGPTDHEVPPRIPTSR